MDRNSESGVKAIPTVCVDGIYIIDKRGSYNRRHKIQTCKKNYERRLFNWAKNFKRRRQLIDIVI